MWEFYVLSTGQINHELGTQESAGLNRIRSMAMPVRYAQLKEYVDRVLGGAN